MQATEAASHFLTSLAVQMPLAQRAIPLVLPREALPNSRRRGRESKPTRCATAAPPPSRTFWSSLWHGERHERGALRFYLHQTGAFDLSQAEHCYLRVLNATAGVDDMDARVTPDDAEHLTDLWLLRKLRAHPQRTDNPAAADVHVLGSPLTTSWRAAGHGIGSAAPSLQ